MGYVIAAIVVLLLVSGFVAFFALNATRKSGAAEPREPSAEGTPAGIAAPDEAAAGDTTQVSDAQEGTDPGPREGRRPRVGDPGPEAEAGAERRY